LGNWMSRLIDAFKPGINMFSFHSKPFILSLLFLLFIVLCAINSLNAQQKDSTSLHAQSKDSVIISHDSTIVIEKKKDTVIKRIYSPRSAAIRSAILPGLGQIYNKKYWKLPIVYGALGVTAYVFFDNLKTYKEYRFAYKARVLAQTPPYDSSLYKQLQTNYTLYDPESIKTARNEFRQYIDYAALVFILFWGLNVVDAAVDAHLKAFDVSPDLSLKIKPTYIPLGNAPGISFVFSFRDHHYK
jgi:uncharacterized protein DUF5683